MTYIPKEVARWRKETAQRIWQRILKDKVEARSAVLGLGGSLA
jgi:hypothetical protein